MKIVKIIIKFQDKITYALVSMSPGEGTDYFFLNTADGTIRTKQTLIQAPNNFYQVNYKIFSIKLLPRLSYWSWLHLHLSNNYHVL